MNQILKPDKNVNLETLSSQNYKLDLKWNEKKSYQIIRLILRISSEIGAEALIVRNYHLFQICCFFIV
jgi:hypothetical protein